MTQAATNERLPGIEQAMLRAREALHDLRLQEALEAFDAALALDPDYYEGHLGRAHTLTRMRRQDEALVAAQCCIELAPERPEGHCALGVLHFLMDHLDEARAALERASALAPTDPEAYLTLSQTQTDLRQYDGAEQSLAHARELVAALPAGQGRTELTALAWHVETYLRLAQGNQHQAMAAAQEVIALREASPYAACLAYSNLGILAARARRYDEAIEMLGQAYALNPYFYRAGTALGRLLIVRRNYARAAQVLGEILERAPEPSSDMHYAYGLALSKGGRRAEARAAYQAALKMGLSGLNRFLALWNLVWLHDLGRAIILGLFGMVVVVWLVVGKPSPQTLTAFAILAMILLLQRVLGQRR